MGLRCVSLLVYLALVILCVETQNYIPYAQYGQYGYTPYIQYSPEGNNGYPYQPYVSNQYVPSTPYYNYPGQGYYQSNYPSYSYVGQGYPSYAQSNQPIRNDPNPVPKEAEEKSTLKPDNSLNPDPYANITTEIIDVEPHVFNYYRNLFKLWPITVVNKSPWVRVQHTRPFPYVVRTESRSSNYSNIPTASVNKHEIQSKTFTFKKTFTVDPSSSGTKVISLNFINGEQVTTTEKPEVYELEERIGVPPTTTQESVAATTENEEPANVLSWIGRR